MLPSPRCARENLAEFSPFAKTLLRSSALLIDAFSSTSDTRSRKTALSNLEGISDRFKAAACIGPAVRWEVVLEECGYKRVVVPTRFDNSSTKKHAKGRPQFYANEEPEDSCDDDSSEDVYMEKEDHTLPTKKLKRTVEKYPDLNQRFTPSDDEVGRAQRGEGSKGASSCVSSYRRARS